MTNTFLDERDAVAAYDRRLKPHRDGFASRPSIALLARGDALPGDLLRLFMIHYAAFGISMTHPVEGWIRRAGERCRETGYAALGDALVRHARHEAGHHRMMVADLWALADAWNGENLQKIDPVRLSRQNLPASIAQYRTLHERVIAGDAPYAQIALEYEIEALSVRHGPALLAAAGDAVAGGGYSFLEEHVAFDEAHTRFNRKQIAELLLTCPDCLEPLVQTGVAALETYGRFIDDCVAATMAFGNATANDGLSCRLMVPPGMIGGTVPEWLMRARSMRSQVLYDGGARPAFGPGGGAFGDADPLDLHCHHLLLLDDEMPVGAGRLTAPGITAAPSLVDATFGRSNVCVNLSRHGIARQVCAEASRLVVHPDFRKGFNPRLLFAGLWALAEDLRANAIIAAVGTGNGQDRLFSILGAKFIDGAGRADAPLFNDTLRLACFRIDSAAPPDYPELDHMRELVRRSRSRAPSKLAT